MTLEQMLWTRLRWLCDVEAVRLVVLLYFTLLREVHWRSLGAVPRRQNGELLAYSKVRIFIVLNMILP